MVDESILWSKEVGNEVSFRGNCVRPLRLGLLRKDDQPQLLASEHNDLHFPPLIFELNFYDFGMESKSDNPDEKALVVATVPAKQQPKARRYRGKNKHPILSIRSDDGKYRPGPVLRAKKTARQKEKRLREKLKKCDEKIAELKATQKSLQSTLNKENEKAKRITAASIVLDLLANPSAQPEPPIYKIYRQMLGQLQKKQADGKDRSAQNK